MVFSNNLDMNESPFCDLTMVKNCFTKVKITQKEKLVNENNEKKLTIFPEKICILFLLGEMVYTVESEIYAGGNMVNKISREEIVRKANELFSEYGYEKVTVNDICSSCGISKPTFYAYIKSKEDIIADFYESVTTDIVEKFVDILEADNHWEQLMICFETLIDKSMNLGPDFQSQLFILNLKEDRGSYDFREKLTNLAVSIITKAQEAGQIRNPNEPLAIYTASAYTFLGYQATWCMKKGKMDWKRELRIALENIYDVDPALRLS